MQNHIITIDDNGKMSIVGLNLISTKLKDDTWNQVKFNVKFSKKTGVSIEKVVIGELKDQKNDDKS